MNTLDAPPSRATAPVTDLVSVQDAVWDSTTGTLSVTARSSDETGIKLTAAGFGDLTATTTDFPGVTAAPASVEVRSEAGGLARHPVRVTGATATGLPPIALPAGPVSAFAGRPVILDGAGSRGATAWSWVQLAGPPVALNAAGATATFTPTATGQVVFELTVTGPAGTDSRQIAVEVTPAPPPDTITVQRSQYRTSRRQLRFSGQCTGPLPNQVTATLNGKLIGSGVVDVTGAWSIVHTVSGADPDLVPKDTDSAHFTSGNGGVADSRITIRN